MKTPFWFVAAALFAAGATASALTMTTMQDKKPKDAGAGMDGMPAWTMPNEQHKLLEPRVGRWNFTNSLVPGETATSEMKSIFGGRFIEDTTKASFMGMPFEGRGFVGYDRIKNKFIATWTDSGSTAIGMVEGTYDAATKTFTFSGEMPDMSGKYSKQRIVQKWTDNDHWTSQFFGPGPDGKEVPQMLLTYTRAK
jgi:hypothetical protein